ncbi:MAG: VOC family protein [Limnohabitans sp.]|nr:VOC family protein [Limnohabitans sp.]
MGVIEHKFEIITEDSFKKSDGMKILELSLLTNDIKSTVEFYTSILNFEVLEMSEVKVVFRVGESKLRFELSAQSIKPKYHFAFNIPYNQIDEARKWLSDRIKLIETEDGQVTHFENWNAKAVYFYDNNENIVEFIVRKDLNNDSNTIFSTTSLISINEVGLVVDSPLQIAEKILQKTGIDFFEKGPKREDFAALGNDEGLFVISNDKRNWYPTQDRAEIFPVSVKIQHKHLVFDLDFNY